MCISVDGTAVKVLVSKFLAVMEINDVTLLSVTFGDTLLMYRLLKILTDHKNAQRKT